MAATEACVSQSAPTLHRLLTGPTDQAAVDTFLSSFKPSRNNDSLGEFTWVRLRREHGADDDALEERKDKLRRKGRRVLDKLTDRLEEIRSTAPVRATREERSQADLRAEARELCIASLVKLAKRYQFASGCWHFSVEQHEIDWKWRNVVEAIVKPDGALAKTGAVHAAKVSAASNHADGKYWLGIYCDDSTDKAAVGRVFQVLRADLKMTPLHYKLDILMLLGLKKRINPLALPLAYYARHDFMTPEERRAEQDVGTRVKSRTLEDEQSAGLADGFESVDESDGEEAPPPKRVKVRA
ncbi:hypothetical protein JCM9279_001323 [Rhodotorula babjevae]